MQGTATAMVLRSLLEVDLHRARSLEEVEDMMDVLESWMPTARKHSHLRSVLVEIERLWVDCSVLLVRLQTAMDGDPEFVVTSETEVLSQQILLKHSELTAIMNRVMGESQPKSLKRKASGFFDDEGGILEQSGHSFRLHNLRCGKARFYQCTVCKIHTRHPHPTALFRWAKKNPCVGPAPSAGSSGRTVVSGRVSDRSPPAVSATVELGHLDLHPSHRTETRGIFIWCNRCGSYSRLDPSRKSHGVGLVKPCSPPGPGGKNALSRVRRGMPPTIGVTDWGSILELVSLTSGFFPTRSTVVQRHLFFCVCAKPLHSERQRWLSLEREPLPCC